MSEPKINCPMYYYDKFCVGKLVLVILMNTFSMFDKVSETKMMMYFNSVDCYINDSIDGGKVIGMIVNVGLV